MWMRIEYKLKSIIIIIIIIIITIIWLYCWFGITYWSGMR